MVAGLLDRVPTQHQEAAMNKIFLFILAVFCLSFQSRNLKHQSKLKTNVPEPSDICQDGKGNYLVASDKGHIYSMNREGKGEKVNDFEGVDLEGICLHGGKVYVVEERMRKVSAFDQNFKKIFSKTIPYSGGKNKSYESIVFNAAKGRFLLITESNPIWIFETDETFSVLNEIKLDYDGDISSATYYKDHLWLLSDVNHEVLKLNPSSYEILGSQPLRINNPEGLCFEKDGTLSVLSDNMGVLMNFKLEL